MNWGEVRRNSAVMNLNGFFTSELIARFVLDKACAPPSFSKESGAKRQQCMPCYYRYTLHMITRLIYCQKCPLFRQMAVNIKLQKCRKFTFQIDKLWQKATRHIFHIVSTYVLMKWSLQAQGPVPHTLWRKHKSKPLCIYVSLHIYAKFLEIS